MTDTPTCPDCLAAHRHHDETGCACLVAAPCSSPDPTTPPGDTMTVHHLDPANWPDSTVALVTLSPGLRRTRTHHGGQVELMTCVHAGVPTALWRANRTGIPFQAYEIHDVRPVAVLDPGNPDHLDRLCIALVEAMSRRDPLDAAAAAGIHPETAAAALRSLTPEPTTPRLDEPRGVGAVVLTYADSILTSIAGHTPGAARWSDTDGDVFAWSDFRAVEILHPGVVLEGS